MPRDETPGGDPRATPGDATSGSPGGDSASPDDTTGSPGDDTTNASGETAGLGARFLALLVDWVLCLMLARLVADSATVGFWVYPFLFAEYGFFVGLYTQTPGMRLAKVRCVASADLGAIGVPRALLRTLLMCLVVPVLIMDSYGRGLHDRAVGSIMLVAPRRPAG